MATLWQHEDFAVRDRFTETLGISWRNQLVVFAPDDQAVSADAVDALAKAQPKALPMERAERAPADREATEGQRKISLQLIAAET